MGQQYQPNAENDELLSEAERAFDLSTRLASMPKQGPPMQLKQPVRRSLFPKLAGFFSVGSASGRL